MKIWTTFIPSEATPRSAQLERLFKKVARALCELPVVPLDPEDVQRASGWLRPGHERVSRQIGEALSCWPHLFPDVPEAAARGALLLERQARASAWFALRDQMRAFASVCNDAGLHELATGSQETAEIADHVLDTVRCPEAYPGLDRRGRLGVLLMGLVWYCEGRRQSCRPVRPRKEPEAEPTPRQAAAEARRKQARRDALHAVFKEWMKEWRRRLP